MLEEAGLTVGEIRREPSENVAEGTIMRISPAVGNKVGEGTPIDLVISNGPPLIPVPDVVGKSQADAEAALVGAGLIVGGIRREESGAVGEGTVIHTDPAAGEGVREGTPVILIISLGSPIIDLGMCGDIAFGSTGDCVREVQRLLNLWGASPPLDIDGDFGSLTDAAVRQFQKDRGLDDDGIVGPL
jgi:hypothetical protein